MSSLNFLAKLLDGAGVRWTPLESCATIDRGRRVTKSELGLGKGYPVYSGGVTPMGFFDKFNQKKDTITIVKYGTAGFVNFIEEDFWANDVCYCIKPNKKLNNKYLFYYLKSSQREIQALATNAIPAHLPTEAISDYPIPIPCPDNPQKSLEIQAEIVRILDAMTTHTAELTAELTARKKQYNYYRDKLLSFEDGEVEWKELGEICRFINGRAYKQPELLDSGKYPVLRVGNFFTNGNWYYSDLELDPDKYCDKGDLLYAWSASFGPRIWEGGKVIYHYHIWKILPDLNLVSKKYLYYLLAWDTEALKAESGTGSTMMHIGKGSIEKRLVPIPSLKKQAQIVSFLDKFDALTASITEGLPREIELRQKQYAYYRDLLLSFPKPPTI